MNILVLTFESDRPERAIFKGLIDHGMKVEILCGAGEKEIDALRQMGMNAQPFPVRNRFDVKAVWRLRSYLRAHPCDLLYAPRNKTLACALLAVRGMPGIKVVAYRGTIGHISRFDPASWMAYLNPRLDLTLCVSDAVRAYLLTCGIPAQRLLRIYKGHDTSWYASSSPRSSLQEFGIPEGSCVVGFVGNMRPVKGVGTLLQAAALLHDSSHLHVLLVGEVRDKGLLDAARRSPVRDRLHWTGFRTDAAALMGACDVFVMPSLEREGLPRAVIEAMAQGVPPVVSRVGGMPELVEDGVSGLHVPPGDAPALAKAISALMADESTRRRYGAAAQKRIREQFHIRTTISAVGDAFRGLVTSRCMADGAEPVTPPV